MKQLAELLETGIYETFTPEKTMTVKDLLEELNLTNKYFLFAVVSYSIKFLWVLFMSYGLFINPGAIKKIIVQILFVSK